MDEGVLRWTSDLQRFLPRMLFVFPCFEAKFAFISVLGNPRKRAQFSPHLLRVKFLIHLPSFLSSSRLGIVPTGIAVTSIPVTHVSEYVRS